MTLLPIVLSSTQSEGGGQEATAECPSLEEERLARNPALRAQAYSPPTFHSRHKIPRVRAG
jgi:hypothetical protein